MQSSLLSGLWRFQPVWVGILLAVVYGPTLAGIAGSWFDPNADMGHGLAVPFITAYMVSTKRETLLRVPVTGNYAGLALIAWGAIQFTVGSAAESVFAIRSSFVISLAGCLWALFGSRVLRELVYPLVVLMLMIAPPTFLKDRITLPLQMIASRLAESALDFLGYSVLRDGNILELVGERLAVVEACSGIRSLYSMAFFGAAYNYFFVHSGSLRWVLLAAIAPLALFGNALRIVATGVVGQYDRQLAHGLLHEAWGFITILVTGALFLLLHRLLVRNRRPLVSSHAP